MSKINYKHLQYFNAVADEGSIHKAADRLNVTPQTISGQIKLLEDQLGKPLLTKAGRNLALTDAGRLALDYSRQIFELGEQLQEVMQLGIDDRPMEFRVGIVDALPKSIAHKLLSPSLGLPGNMRIICHEEQMTTLLGELAVHRLDIVMADSPMPPGMNIRCFNHALGQSPLACFAAPELAEAIRSPFPQCLQDAPILVPTDTASGLRTELLSWFKREDLQIRITGEFDDSALLKAFGSQGHGFFFAPDVIREEICSKYRVRWIGTVQELTQEFYAISADRRITHPAVKAITEQQPLGG